VAGVVVGAVLGPRAAVLEPLGTLFIRLIRMVIVPLIASSLVVAIAGLPGRGALGRMGARAFAFIFISLFIALHIGIGFGLFFHPGSGLSEETRAVLFAAQDPSAAPATVTPPERPSLWDTLVDVVPTNMVGAAAEGNILQVLFVSVIFGLGTSALAEERRRALIHVLRAVSEVMVKLVGWIMVFAPVGVFGLMAAVVGRSGLSVVGSLGYYVLIVIMALAAHVALTYTFVLVVLARESLVRFYRAIRPQLLIAFGTCSTAAALPVSMRVMQSEMGLSDRVTSFVLPLGTALGRDGSGIYQAISVLFIAQVYNHTLGAAELGTLILTALLAALAVASVPAASFVNLTIILSALGLPLEGAALVLGVERPLDMLRTSTNLIGQLAGATWVAASEGVPSAD
jgi:Na+/H+-dicarboxylate symporter